MTRCENLPVTVKRKYDTLSTFEYRMMAVFLLFDLREREKQKRAKDARTAKKGAKGLEKVGNIPLPILPTIFEPRTENVPGRSYNSCPYHLFLVDKDHERVRVAEN